MSRGVKEIISILYLLLRQWIKAVRQMAEKNEISLLNSCDVIKQHHCDFLCPQIGKDPGAGEVARWQLGAHAASSEDPPSIPSTHLRELRTL